MLEHFLENEPQSGTPSTLEESSTQLAENSNPEQETSTAEVAKETTEDRENIQDMTNMTFEKLEENSRHNFITEADDCNDKADVLVKRESESSLKDEHPYYLKVVACQ